MDVGRIILYFIFMRAGLCFKNYDWSNTPQHTNAVKTCIVGILSSKILYKSLVVVVNNEVSNDLLYRIHALNNVKVCVKEEECVHMKVTPDVYLIHPQNRRKFEHLIDSLDKDWYRQPEALHIIIMQDITGSGLELVFRILWEYHLIHVLVLVYVNDEDISIYTYYPYAEGKCGRDYANITKLGNCENVKDFDVVEKLKENDKPVISKCTLNVATRNYPPLVMCDPVVSNKRAVGIERFLVEMLLARENVSLNYTCLPETEDAGTVSDNFTVSGMMKKLYDNKVDMVFGALSLNNRRAEFFDFLCLHLANEDPYVAATPCADLIERWKMVYIMFNANVWLLLLFILILCAILLTDFRNIWIIRNSHASVSEILNLFGNATQNIALALKERLSKNFVIIHWLWFIFLINCFYQTGLTSFTTHRSYKPQLDHYLSLRDHNFSPCIPWDVFSFLKHSGQVTIMNEQYYEQVREKCETAEMALNEVAGSNNKYTLVMYFQYLLWTTEHRKEKHRIHLMKENLYNNLYALFFKRGFPLLSTFNAKMLRLPEHGFVHSIKDFHGLPRELRSDRYMYVQTSIKLDDLTVPFGILVSGFIFSSLVLIIEIAYKYKISVNRLGTLHINA